MIIIIIFIQFFFNIMMQNALITLWYQLAIKGSQALERFSYMNFWKMTIYKTQQAYSKYYLVK